MKNAEENNIIPGQIGVIGTFVRCNFVFNNKKDNDVSKIKTNEFIH